MANYRLSALADTDILGIAAYTIEHFGIEQARRYRDGLERILQMLAEQPGRGRSAIDLARNLRRFEYEAHIIFYMPERQGVLIVRILHQRMDIERHLPIED